MNLKSLRKWIYLFTHFVPNAPNLLIKCDSEMFFTKTLKGKLSMRHSAFYRYGVQYHAIEIIHGGNHECFSIDLVTRYSSTAMHDAFEENVELK